MVKYWVTTLSSVRPRSLTSRTMRRKIRTSASATGTNHVLPTYGYAATYSSLGLADFTKRMTVQEMTPQGFEKLGPAIALLAHAEELDAHMNPVLVRMDRIKQSKE